MPQYTIDRQKILDEAKFIRNRVQQHQTNDDGTLTQQGRAMYEMSLMLESLATACKPVPEPHKPPPGPFRDIINFKEATTIKATEWDTIGQIIKDERERMGIRTDVAYEWEIRNTDEPPGFYIEGGTAIE